MRLKHRTQEVFDLAQTRDNAVAVLRALRTHGLAAGDPATRNEQATSLHERREARRTHPSRTLGGS